MLRMLSKLRPSGDAATASEAGRSSAVSEYRDGRGSGLRLTLLAIAGVTLVVIVVVVAPQVLVTSTQVPDTAGRLKLQNDVRGTLLQGLGGTLFLSTAYFAWGQLRTAQRQLALAEQGQITDRFSQAVEHLNGDGLIERLGGIYALERLARTSVAHRAAIGDVLSAFVRSKASWASAEKVPGSIWKVPPLQVRAPDVQAVMTVLGSRDPPPPEARPLELNDVDLRRAFIDKASFQGAYLVGAHLEGAVLDDTDFSDAHLRDAHLDSASVRGAQFETADLTGAVFVGALADHTTWPEQFNPVQRGVRQG